MPGLPGVCIRNMWGIDWRWSNGMMEYWSDVKLESWNAVQGIQFQANFSISMINFLQHELNPLTAL